MDDTDELLLGDELLLLSLSEDGELRSPETIEMALAGACLVELALASRVGFEDDKLKLVGTGGTGQPLLDAALAELEGSRRARPASYWVEKLQRGKLDAHAERLESRGLVTTRARRVLGLTLRRRHPPVESEAAAAIRERLHAAAATRERNDPRTAALARLLEGYRTREKTLSRGEQPDLAAAAEPSGAGADVDRTVEATIAAIDSALVALLFTAAT